MKRLILEQSNDEFYTSHSGLALVGACINHYSDLGRTLGSDGLIIALPQTQLWDENKVGNQKALMCLMFRELSFRKFNKDGNLEVDF